MWQIFYFVSCLVQCILCVKVSEISTQKIGVAISPIWDDDTQSVYFINLIAIGNQSSIFRYSVDDDKFYAACIPEMPSSPPIFISPVRQNRFKCKRLFAVGIGYDVMLIDWDGKSTVAKVVNKKLFSVKSTDPLSRTDFARADRHGRLYGGTFSNESCAVPPNKSFYRYTPSNGVETMFSDIYATSGVAFDEEKQKMFQSDLCSLLIIGFNWNPATGILYNRSTVFDFKWIGKSKVDFGLLGLDVDSNGLIYTTGYDNSVWVINPSTRSVVDVIDIGIDGVTGAILGGRQRNTLYVTVSSNFINLSTGTVTNKTITNGSSLYKVTGLGVTGAKSTRMKIPEFFGNTTLKCGSDADILTDVKNEIGIYATNVISIV